MERKNLLSIFLWSITEGRLVIMKNKKIIYLSIIATVFSAFTIGIQIDRTQIIGPNFKFGFPAKWLEYFGLGQFGFNIFGLIFNYLFFYLLFYLLSTFLNKIMNTRKRERNKGFVEK